MVSGQDSRLLGLVGSAGSWAFCQILALRSHSSPCAPFQRPTRVWAGLASLCVRVFDFCPGPGLGCVVLGRDDDKFRRVFVQRRLT